VKTKRRVSRSKHGAVMPVVILCALIGAACAGGPAPRDDFYRMEVTPPEPWVGEAVHDGILMVERFSSDALVRGRPILYRRSESSLQVVPHSHQLWTDSPSLLLQGEMIDYLRAAGVAREVVSTLFRGTPDWILRGHIDRLEYIATPDGNRAVVELRIRISQPRAQEALLARSYRVERNASPGGVEEAVRAISEALTELLADLSRDLKGPP
jgi:uncharacterized lipoprotein YmbA